MVFLTISQFTLQEKAFTLAVCPSVSSAMCRIPLFLIYSSATVN